MPHPIMFSPRARFSLNYSHLNRLRILEPFIKSVSAGLADGNDFSDQLQVSAQTYPDAAAHFHIDLPTADESFRLKDEFTFDSWSISSMVITTPVRSFSLNLRDCEEGELSNFHDFIAMIARGNYTAAASSRTLFDDRLRRLFNTFRDSEVIVEAAERCLPLAASSQPAVYRLQHASLLYRSRTTGVIVDPHLQSTYNPLSGDDILRRDLGDKVDGILISHSHLDHFWLPSLMMFDRNTPIVVPKVPVGTLVCMDMKQKLLEVGFTNVIAHDWYSDPILIGDVEISVLPFYGEQPLRYEQPRDPHLRNWGNTYVVRCDGYTSWFLIDTGIDHSGSMIDVADYVRATFGKVDFLLSNLREFCVCSPTYINGGLNWLALTASQMKRFSQMKRDCLTLGPANVAEICKRVDARFYLPYAHWWGRLGHIADSALDSPGQDECGLIAALRSSLSAEGSSTKIVPWKIGEGFDGSGEKGLITLGRHSSDSNSVG